MSKADSNHHKQNQNLLCYHYTIGHPRSRIRKFGCKGKKYLAHRQIFLHLLLFNYQKIIVLLTLLCQQVLAVDEIFGSDSTILVGELLLIQ